MPKDYNVPSTAKQVYAQKTLDAFRNSMLIEEVHRAAARVDPQKLHDETVTYVSTENSRKLQGAGIREETVFALPSILLDNPKLLGYYRMLMGISEKQFYNSISGLSGYRQMEHEGTIGRHTEGDIQELCIAINKAIDDFLAACVSDTLSLDLPELPIMTLGVYVDGVWRNNIGTNAARSVFASIREIVSDSGISVSDKTATSFLFTTKNGREFTVISGSDPDVQIFEIINHEKHTILCIEIKGGQDVANVHNRAGEAEKSHQKAKSVGWQEAWTVIYLAGLTDDQKNKILTEAPTTDHWFDINQVVARGGDSYEDFNKSLKLKLGIS